LIKAIDKLETEQTELEVSIFKGYSADIQIRAMFVIRSLVFTRCLADTV